MATKGADIPHLPPLTRLSEPVFDAEASKVYESAIDALEREHVEFMLGGAVALNAHSGVWRDTKDIDVFVRPAHAKRALRALQSAGFSTQTVYESWLGKGWKGDHFVDVIWRNANALLPVTDAWFDPRSYVHLFGRDVMVISVEDFLVSKMMVMGRYRYDGADLLHVLFMAADKVDWDRLARLCGEHIGLMTAHLHTFRWAYPAWRHKVPDEVLTRFARLAHDAESTMGPFRGRLIDIQSFEVDVQEWGMPDPHRKALENIFGDADGRS